MMLEKTHGTKAATPKQKRMELAEPGILKLIFKSTAQSCSVLKGLFQDFANDQTIWLKYPGK